MRAINYLSDKASRLDEDKKTLAVIDRAQADAGLRRKGSGRAIPEPTVREELFFMLAVVGRRKVSTAIGDARRWASLPCRSGRGPHFRGRQMKPLIDVLEELCRELRTGRLHDEFGLELEMVSGMATIIFPNSDQQEHLLFMASHVGPSFQRETTVSIKSEFLINIAMNSVIGD